MPEIGVATSVRVEHIVGSEDVGPAVNGWLENNPDVEVIEMKFATCANEEEWATDVLIIYRKEI